MDDVEDRENLSGQAAALTAGLVNLLVQLLFYQSRESGHQDVRRELNV